jgi:hypothetical protein
MHSLSRHFRPDVPTRRFDFILGRPAVQACNPSAAASFISHGLHLKLRLDRPPSFLVVLQLARVVPSLLERNFEMQMTAIIHSQPRKAIVVLAYMAQNYAMLSGPGGLLDLLFTHSNLFFRSECGPELISILFYLCSSYDDYRAMRLKECQSVFLAGLARSDSRTVVASYHALYHYYDQGLALNANTVAEHLGMADTASAALSFFVKLRHPPANEALIGTLIPLAQRDERALLVLVNLARTIEYARILAQFSPSFLKFAALDDALRLLLIIFMHDSLRSGLLGWPEVPAFLAELAREREARHLQAVAAVICGLAPTKAFISALSESHALEALFAAARGARDGGAFVAALRVLATLGEVDFAPEYLILPQTIADELRDDSEYTEICIGVVVILSRYPLCAQKFVQLGLGRYFKALQGNPAYREQAETFLANTAVSEYYNEC